jgi:hypothetical protein
MDAGLLEEDASKDELPRWREEKALPRMPLLDCWDRMDQTYPGLALANRHISVNPASAALVERMFSNARRSSVQHGGERPRHYRQALLPAREP